MKLTLAQLNFTVGDLTGNYDKILAAHKIASKDKADLLVLSELAVTGYPPEDLMLRQDFQDQALAIIHKIKLLTLEGPAILLGGPWREDNALYNAAILLDGGQIQQISYKTDLPNYGVFDEKRIFTPGKAPQIMECKGVKLGVIICEEMWRGNAAKQLQQQGAELLLVINASPFEHDKYQNRLKIARQNVADTDLPLIYLNQIGGQDELVFDGNSFILSDKSELIFTAASFAEEIVTIAWHSSDKNFIFPTKRVITTESEKYAIIYNALKLGLQDYVKKNGFKGVLLGMSGGIDSAISAAIAADALGRDKVRLIMMPSKYTSKTSLIDAAECAALLGIKLENIPIESIIDSYNANLAASFANISPGISDTTAENLQSRIRGNILMALSNKFGHMVLTTGNKSEISVGYATLYGDMCGGFNVLKDIYKTDIFALCHWRNRQNTVIPLNIITKEPTAELKPGQKDADTLPPYEILDKILYSLLELRQSSQSLINAGFAAEVVNKVSHMVGLAEYKRRQAAPGVKISNLSFGRDWRHPITNKFKL